MSVTTTPSSTFIFTLLISHQLCTLHTHLLHKKFARQFQEHFAIIKTNILITVLFNIFHKNWKLGAQKSLNCLFIMRQMLVLIYHTASLSHCHKHSMAKEIKQQLIWLNPLWPHQNRRATDHYIAIRRLVHWPLMGGLLHLLQQGGALASWPRPVPTSLCRM